MSATGDRALARTLARGRRAAVRTGAPVGWSEELAPDAPEPPGPARDPTAPAEPRAGVVLPPAADLWRTDRDQRARPAVRPDGESGDRIGDRPPSAGPVVAPEPDVSPAPPWSTQPVAPAPAPRDPRPVDAPVAPALDRPPAALPPLPAPLERPLVAPQPPTTDGWAALAQRRVPSQSAAATPVAPVSRPAPAAPPPPPAAAPPVVIDQIQIITPPAAAPATDPLAALRDRRTRYLRSAG